jgi:regulator of sirC expression with transglutaminase-like and TPR domain
MVFDSIGPALDIKMATVAGAVEEVMHRGAEEMESYAKSNAPWTDRTGDARAGLHADVDTSLGDITIELAHAVDYGIYLELKDDGKYAILMPTIEALGPRILREAAAVVILV